MRFQFTFQLSLHTLDEFDSQGKTHIAAVQGKEKREKLTQGEVIRKILPYWPDEDLQSIPDILNTYGDGKMERG